MSQPRRPAAVASASRRRQDVTFDNEPIHHRWLLTTCVAGIAGSLIVGGTILGLFGENIAPRDANAAVQRASITGFDTTGGTKTSMLGDYEAKP